MRSRGNVPEGKLTRENLSGMLDVYASGVTSLEGLQCLPWLTIISVESGELSDISPLRNLQRLREIVLSNNKIQDISPISRGGVDAESPWYIDLSGNPILNLETFELPSLPVPEPSCSNFLLEKHPGTQADREIALSYCARGWAVLWSSTDPNIEHVQCFPDTCTPPLFVEPNPPSTTPDRKLNR